MPPRRPTTSLAQELERLGALKAVEGKPSFNCAAARLPSKRPFAPVRPSPISTARFTAPMSGRLGEATNPKMARDLKRQQDDFIARRNAQFGKPGYDLQKAMRERLQQINGIDGY